MEEVTTLLQGARSVVGSAIPLADLATPIEDVTMADVIRMQVSGNIALPDAFGMTCVTPRYTSVIAGKTIHFK